ncbi:DUF3311 domain-containing protein [Sporosarcina sp. JAI121]|uniref:DUF3311 domain-containing protein n=1 Tax=Sporosarcina sp. JAI121 TaxID=2723064 RepID=UPI0015C9937F|nr:DUF3311 domain-containing protein [Sporosarcina sp. JAI121]NYF23261.1 4-amino-4-deoxy-L-arabinose transferase-like glycosyltransferase [Sporosarcina sp. JAI121]
MKYIKLLIAVPFIGFLGLLPWANRIEPYILGMPFLLFWLVLWMVISPLLLTIVYKFDPDNKEGETE